MSVKNGLKSKTKWGFIHHSFMTQFNSNHFCFVT